MKCILAFVVVCIALTYAENAETAEERLPNTGALIKKKIEELRDDFKSKGYNDFNFENFSLPIDSDALGIRAQIKASGRILNGLEFEVKKFSGLVFSYNFDIIWNDEKGIDILIEPYDLQGYVHLIQVYGTGKIHINLKEFGIFGKLNVFPVPNDSKHLYVKALNLKVKLGKKQDDKWFSLTGWLNDEVRSEIISAMLTENLQDILVEFEKEIGLMLGAAVVDLVKDVKIPLPV